MTLKRIGRPSSLALLSLLIGILPSVSARAAGPACDLSKLDLKAIMAGVPASEFVARMRQVCDFIEKANAKLHLMHPERDVQIVGGGQLQTVREEGVEVVMVVGRSADFKPEEAARVMEVRAEMLSFLRRFNPEKTIFIGGGTASGDIGLFHELATRMGFTMEGFTPISGVEYEPAFMTHLYLEAGLGFGAESNTAIHTSTSILMLGGGKQSVRETVKSAFLDSRERPVYIVDSPLFGGKAAEASAALKDFKNVQVFKSAATAADVMAKRTSTNLLKLLPEGAFDSTIEDFLDVYRGKYKLAFSTWADKAPSPEAQIKFEKFAFGVIDGLDPEHVIINVAGTKNGGEGKIIEYAIRKGFTVVGTPALAVSPGDLSPQIRQFIETGTTWATRNRFFVSTFDGLVTAGESLTILQQLEAAQKAGKDVFNVQGVSSAIDVFAANLGTGPNYTAEMTDQAVATIVSNYPCKKVLRPEGSK